jgi:hypothetical protein
MNLIYPAQEVSICALPITQLPSGRRVTRLHLDKAELAGNPIPGILEVRQQVYEPRIRALWKLPERVNRSDAPKECVLKTAPSPDRDTSFRILE